ncbi:MAG: undecaprenyl diphosphate synthase family protein [Christensenellaceae bacterium]|jgi:undecaprenyl diphosphate synthase|nr:undecaprenyl diphosphate synthase family protein [Christensenellaceae bacterium]
MNIGIIADGNGRYGVKTDGSRLAGYKHGADAILRLMRAQKELGIEYMTVFVFSQDNFNRPKEEVETIFKTVGDYFETEVLFLAKLLLLKCKIVGDWSAFPEEFRDVCENLELETKDYTQTLSFAINYSGRDEICKAAQLAAAAYTMDVSSRLDETVFNLLKEVDFMPHVNSLESITQRERSYAKHFDIEKYLSTAGYPDPDIIIRYGDKKRLSDFMLFQCAYSEIYFLKKMFPEFEKSDLEEAIAEFKNTKRTFGGISL